MSDKQTAQVIVMRCLDLPEPIVPSDLRQCGSCDQNCWASKSVTAMEAKYDVTYTCQVCSPPAEILAAGKKINVLESQRADLEASLGTWGASMALRRLGIAQLGDDW